MKSKIAVYILFVMLTSCKSQVVKENDNDNVLLGDKVTVYDEVFLVNDKNPEEWVKGIERDKLFSSLFYQIFKENQQVYSPNTEFPDYNNISSNEDIMRIFGWNEPKEEYGDLKEILFTEEWDISSNFKKFTKKVNYYCPIRVYFREGTQELLKAKTFYVKPTSNKKGKQVAKNIFLEFDLGLAVFPHYSGLDDRKLVNTTFDAIQAGTVTVYDPIYIVDKSRVPFTPDELEEFLGISLSSDNLRNSVLSIITEEDWYFDAESMNISKEIKSLGFVSEYFEDGKFKSKILFFIMFD